MKYSSAEVKSGALITVSFVVLLALTFVVGNLMHQGNQQIKIKYGYIAGIEVGTAVFFVGREVGKVESIEIQKGGGRPALVTLRIADEIEVREDSEVFIDNLNMMSDKILNITAGSEGAPLLKPGTVLKGVDPIPMHEMISKMDLLADRMDEMTESLIPMTQNANILLEGSKEEIAKTIANAEEISANIRDMTHDLKFRPWRLLRKD